MTLDELREATGLISRLARLAKTVKLSPDDATKAVVFRMEDRLRRLGVAVTPIKWEPPPQKPQGPTGLKMRKAA